MEPAPHSAEVQGLADLSRVPPGRLPKRISGDSPDRGFSVLRTFTPGYPLSPLQGGGEAYRSEQFRAL
ncbi:hypothetical protein [Prosthecobacter dejongeii]|uniref:Uncharacterized protein n=1 Tax=Prosthecobacter dejongeii TaxID=48465 RepID=A0A7W7YKB8_9BACT|nr:hypothetical protein [Prosthecobacter dejongeii]MBB5037657.1 hypothetical protein [Prosthecobacter dejongeii]